MKAIANLLFVIGVCAATVGAAGFHDPTRTEREGATAANTESMAWPLFAGGLAVIGAGSAVNRMGRSGAARGGEHLAAALGSIAEVLHRIRNEVASIDDAKSSLDGPVLCQRIDALFRGDYFDLVDKREDLLALVGFGGYAAVWDGVATAERQLARVWSIATDGFLEQSLEDLPAARASLDRAVEAMKSLETKG